MMLRAVKTLRGQVVPPRTVNTPLHACEHWVLKGSLDTSAECLSGSEPATQMAFSRLPAFTRPSLGAGGRRGGPGSPCHVALLREASSGRPGTRPPLKKLPPHSAFCHVTLPAQPQL